MSFIIKTECERTCEWTGEWSYEDKNKQTKIGCNLLDKRTAIGLVDTAIYLSVIT